MCLMHVPPPPPHDTSEACRKAVTRQEMTEATLSVMGGKILSYHRAILGLIHPTQALGCGEGQTWPRKTAGWNGVWCATRDMLSIIFYKYLMWICLHLDAFPASFVDTVSSLCSRPSSVALRGCRRRRARISAMQQRLRQFIVIFIARQRLRACFWRNRTETWRAIRGWNKHSSLVSGLWVRANFWRAILSFIWQGEATSNACLIRPKEREFWH